MTVPPRYPHSSDAPHGDEHGADRAELAELAAAGALSESEQEHLEALLAAGDPVALSEHARTFPALLALLNGVPPSEPSAAMRERALGCTGGPSAPQHQPTVEDPGEDHARPDEPLVVLRYGEVRFRPTGIPGISARTIFADRAANRRTLLLRMEPGSVLPDHDHAGIEEVFMIEGDLSIDARTLGPRDYFRARPGTRHGPPTTKNGCVCLIFSDYGSISPRSKLSMAWWAAKAWVRRGLRRSA